MSIITLTTDFGTVDFYVARLKGMILSNLSNASFIDVTHHVKNFDIQSAAFQVKHMWKSFPQHSLHFVGVGAEIAPKNRWIACKHKQHFFVLPDNGLITLILDTAPEQVVTLQNMSEENFEAYMASCISTIIKEKSILGVGDHMGNYVERGLLQPVVSSHLIRGSINYVDKYGNLITNISRSLFEEHRKDRQYQIINRAIQFDQFHTQYADVEPGGKVAFFNSLDLLEVSINQGNASQLFGLKVGDTIQIEFL